ncbi:MAG TPA: CorA family divalent cation transporter [Candidatus Paceibacterota bacterium]
MIKQFRHKEITWIDVTSPTKDELTQLSKDYNIHSLVENEASSPSVKSRVDLYDSYLYLILHFPECKTCIGDVKKAKTRENIREVDFILSEKFLITIHYEPIQVLEEFSEIFEASFSQSNSKNPHAGFLFFQILIQIYRSLDFDLNCITSELQKAQNNIFNGKEKEMIKVLANINEDLLDFSWALKGHDKILKSLSESLDTLFPDQFKAHNRSLRDTYWRIYSTVVNLREFFTDLRITNDSLLTIKTNEIIKILTIMAFVTFPLSVLTSTFGMNTVNTPIIGHHYDFWLIVIIMMVAVALMFVYFRYKRWL